MILCLLLALLSFSSFHSFGHYSPKRLPHEDYRDKFLGIPKIIGSKNKAVYRESVSYEQLNIEQAPIIENYEDLQQIFSFMRDHRFLNTHDLPRRISWLYPDDGCYNRAEMAHIPMEELGITVLPAKIFIFGNLEVKTDNHPDGIVYWWYHVAPAYRHQETLYVLDPSLDSLKPLALADWKKLMQNNQQEVTFSLCSSHTYTPDTDCYSPSMQEAEKIEDHQRDLLTKEWERQVELGRDPAAILGDSPPWKKRTFLDFFRDLFR